MKQSAGCSIALLLLFTLAAASFAQNVTTVAGGFVGDNRRTTKASFQVPTGIVRDTSGNTGSAITGNNASAGSRAPELSAHISAPASPASAGMVDPLAPP